MEFETFPLSSVQKLTGSTGNDKNAPSYRVVIEFKDNEMLGRIVLSAQDLNEFSKRLNYFPFIRENYCVVAINNLLKKSDFLQLSLQHSEKLISDEEFETELEENSERYLIELNNTPTGEEINVISEIVGKLNRRCSSDEVSEMFSISPHCLINNSRFLTHK